MRRVGGRQADSTMPWCSLELARLMWLLDTGLLMRPAGFPRAVTKNGHGFATTGPDQPLPRPHCPGRSSPSPARAHTRAVSGCVPTGSSGRVVGPAASLSVLRWGTPLLGCHDEA